MENKRVMKLPKKHLWKPEEDMILKNYVEAHGEGNWATVSQQSGLMRGGKSCRLRWKNYLRPNIKRGVMSEEEEDLIVRMHKLIGNRWSLIAGRLPGRTDNEVKNYWNTHLNKRCPKRKRKHYDKNRDQTEIIIPQTTPEKNKTGDPQSTIAEIPSTDGSDKVRVEEKNTQLVGDMKNFDYGIEMDRDESMFVFDDEPLPTYVESFLFFEAFGCTVMP